jgi:hypothetical protein
VIFLKTDLIILINFSNVWRPLTEVNKRRWCLEEYNSRRTGSQTVTKCLRVLAFINSNQNCLPNNQRPRVRGNPRKVGHMWESIWNVSAPKFLSYPQCFLLLPRKDELKFHVPIVYSSRVAQKNGKLIEFYRIYNDVKFNSHPIICVA